MCSFLNESGGTINVSIFHQAIRIQHRIFFRNTGRDDQFSKSFWVRSGDQDLILINAAENSCFGHIFEQNAADILFLFARVKKGLTPPPEREKFLVNKREFQEIFRAVCMRF